MPKQSRDAIQTPSSTPDCPARPPKANWQAVGFLIVFILALRAPSCRATDKQRCQSDRSGASRSANGCGLPRRLRVRFAVHPTANGSSHSSNSRHHHQRVPAFDASRRPTFPSVHTTALICMPKRPAPLQIIYHIPCQIPQQPLKGPARGRQGLPGYDCSVRSRCGKMACNGQPIHPSTA